MYKLNTKANQKLFGIGKIFQNRVYLNCWKCNKHVDEVALICPQCTTIQKPPAADNYFSVLNIDECFDIDLKKLTNKYRQMQSILHPDKFANKSSDEKNISAEYSSLVNKAFDTLQTPLNRAVHMLKLRNITIDEDDKASDPKFLMEILELNEEIDECKTNEQLILINKKNKETLHEISVELSKCLKSNDVHNAKQLVIKMKYYNSISLRINHLLREQGILE